MANHAETCISLRQLLHSFNRAGIKLGLLFNNAPAEDLQSLREMLQLALAASPNSAAAQAALAPELAITRLQALVACSPASMKSLVSAADTMPHFCCSCIDSDGLRYRVQHRSMASLPCFYTASFEQSHV